MNFGNILFNNFSTTRQIHRKPQYIEFLTAFPSYMHERKDLEKGTFIKIRPHETEFIQTPDPRSILELELRNFTCLTKGETIPIKFMDKIFKIDIEEVKPESNYNAVCIIEANIEMDFLQPIDYQENVLPSLNKKSSSVVMQEEEQKKNEQNLPFHGASVRIDGKQEISKIKSQPKEQENQNQAFDPRKHRLQNGVRKQIIQDDFEGKQGVQLGKTDLNKKKK